MSIMCVAIVRRLFESTTTATVAYSTLVEQYLQCLSVVHFKEYSDFFLFHLSFPLPVYSDRS